MPPEPQSLNRNATLLMLLLCTSWGLNQVCAKIALADMGPITQCALRSIGGSLIVAAYAWRREPAVWRRNGDFWPGVAVGVLFAFEFIILFVAIQYTSAARAILFLFAAPFFVALGALAFLPQERLRAVQWVGMALAFCGVSFGLLGRVGPDSLFGDGLALLAAAAWGATTVLIKASALRASPPTKVLLYQIVISAIVSPPIALLAGETWPTHISDLSALSLSYQIVWVVGISYGLWFMLLAHYRAGELSAFTFLTPVVGVFAGHILLGDALSGAFVIALALVAGGIVLVNWPAANPRLAAPAFRPNPE